jgi:hypothetical protein
MFFVPDDVVGCGETRFRERESPYIVAGQFDAV